MNLEVLFQILHRFLKFFSPDKYEKIFLKERTLLSEQCLVLLE